MGIAGCLAPSSLGATRAGYEDEADLDVTEASASLGVEETSLSLEAGPWQPEIAAWDQNLFEHVRSLQEAPRSRGTVELYRNLSSGDFVAVKCVPSAWITRDPRRFQAEHGRDEEPY